MSERALKAWQVDDEEHSVVVFHHHGLAARREGANDLNCEFEDVSCSRAKRFDAFAELGFVPTKDLIEAGWWFECAFCYARIDEDVLASAVTYNHVVYCSPECDAAHDTEVLERKISNEEFLLEISHNRPDFVMYPLFNGQSANFKFSGCKYGGSVYCDKGVNKWFVAQGDSPLWNIYDTYAGIEDDANNRTCLALGLIAVNAPNTPEGLRL